MIKIARELMTLYSNYLAEIEKRKKDGLNPKPIENGELLKEIISQIKDPPKIPIFIFCIKFIFLFFLYLRFHICMKLIVLIRQGLLEEVYLLICQPHLQIQIHHHQRIVLKCYALQ